MRVYRFHQYELDEACVELRCAGRALRIEPKALRALAYLIRNRHRVVPKDELVEALWPNEAVTDSSLTYCVHAVRKALGGDPGAHAIVKTVHRHGYRFVAEVEEIDGSGWSGPPAASELVRESAAEMESAAGGGQSPFVGRAHELAEIERAIARALRGRGSLALVCGEPGVGKTRVAAEAAARAAARGLRVLSGASDETGGAPAYAPFARALFALVGTLSSAALAELLGEGAAWVARLLPGLARRLPDLPALPALPPEREQYQVLESTAAFVAAAARRTPLFLVLEDLHWADESTVRLLLHLSRTAAESPLVILATYRAAPVDQSAALRDALPALLRLPHAREIRLGGLDSAALRELLAALADADPPAAMVGAIHRETEGNPLFVEQCFELLRDEGELFDERGQWRSTIDFASVGVPHGIKLLIEHRLRRLSPLARHVLGSAAVIGRRFAYELLERVLDVGGEALLEAIEEAERMCLIAGRAQGGAILYTFSHEIIWHVLYEELSPPRRRRLHRAVAAALESSGGLDGRAAALAYHLQAGGAEADSIRRSLVEAGDEALAASAFDEAGRYYERALALSAGGGEAQGELLFRRAAAAQRAGHSAAAVESFADAALLFERAGCRARLEETCLSLALLRGVRGEFSAMFATLQRGLAAHPDSRSAVRARLLLLAARSLANAGEPGQAAELVRQAEEIARVRQDASLIGNVLAVRGAAQWIYMDLDEAARTLGCALELLRAARDLPALLLALNDQIITFGYLGRLAEMEAAMRELEVLSGHLGDWGGKSVHALFEALLGFVRGQLAAAARRAEAAAEAARCGSLLVLPAALQLGAEVAHAAGDAGAAASLYAQAAEASEEMGALASRYVGRLPALQARCWQGDGCAVAELLSNLPPVPSAAEPLSAAWYDSMATAAGALAAAGLAGRAEPYYAPLRRIRERGAVFGSVSFPLLERVLGMIAAGSGRLAEARAHYDAALVQAEDRGVAKETAHTLYWSAAALLERDAARARPLAERARSMYGDLGMPFHLEHARALCERAAAPATARGRKSRRLERRVRR